jgi:GTP-binding protein EngB required for normal cell division
VETSTKGLYTSALTDPNVNLSQYGSKAENLFSLKSEYVSPVNFNYALPSFKVPELAFVGRSNVGKSSLISSLLSDRNLVRISKQPGCTRTVNYFGFVDKNFELLDGSKSIVNMGQHLLYLVDLPGMLWIC